MEPYIIYNAVPFYEQERAAVDLLKEHPSIIQEDMENRNIEKAYLILPKGEDALFAAMEERTSSRLTCVKAPDRAGMVYQNFSALSQVVRGEKPIPSGMNGSEQGMAVSVSSLGGHWMICVELPNGACKNVLMTGEMTVRELVSVGGAAGEIKAVYTGHPCGAVYREGELDCALEPEVTYVKVFGAGQCALDELTKIASLYRKDTCGRCVFGHEGSAQLSMILNDMTQKKGRTGDVALMQDLCQVMSRQTLCEVGRSLARTVMDTMEKFREEIDAHLIKKTCPAGVCRKFATYHILAAKCVGCTDCIDECEEGAILGKKRFVHVINQEDCTQCGDCLSFCQEGAIVSAMAEKPRCPIKPIPCKR